MDAALSRGAFAFYLLLGGALALVLGLILLFFYRRAVDQAMRAAGAAEGRAAVGLSATGLSDIGQRLLRPPELTIQTLAATAFRRDRGRLLTPTFRGARAAMRRTVLVYLSAGLAQAVVSVLLLFTFSGTAFLPLRTSISVWAYAWPVVLTLTLIWARDRRRVWTAVAGYFAALVAMGAAAELFTDTPPLPVAGIALPAVVQPLLVWAAPALPTAFLLLFLNRRVRAVGPLLLTFLLVALAGAHTAFILMATPTGMRATAAAAVDLGIDVRILFYLLQAAGFGLFALPGAALALWVRNLYLRKRLSDQTLILDSIWLLAALVLCSSLAVEQPLWGWLGLAAFAVYKLVVRIGLRPVQAAATARRPARLLLLRVFGDRARSERLLDLLGSRWRYAGPIQMIAGTDLATSSVEPDEFLDFLSGRLHRRFIRSAEASAERLRAIDQAPDPDGRFRINELFCSGDAWQATVSALMQANDLVVMDLRGFSAANRGCIFELGALVDTVRVDRITFLIDDSTDRDLLRRVIEQRWQAMRATSPNATAASATITLLSTSGAEAAAVRALIRMADEILAGASPPATSPAAAPSTQYRQNPVDRVPVPER